MQKPPGSKRQSVESKSRVKPTQHPSGAATDRPSRSEKSKAGRTLYYDDTDKSVSHSSASRSKTPQPQMRPRRDGSPHHTQTARARSRPASTINGLGLAPIGNTFHREESPEPPPIVYRSTTRTDHKPHTGGTYRHSVHVDAPASRQYVHQTHHSNRSRSDKQAPPTSYKWQTQLQKKTQDQSDSDSYRTASPASSGNAERNRTAMKKILQTRYKEQNDPGRIVISPPYNL